MLLAFPRPRSSPPPLRPAGHNAAAEALVQPIILLGSTLLAVIACYVLADQQLQALFAGAPTTQDVLVIVLVGGLGLMVDTAMVLAASRLRMHLARGRRDWPWSVITGAMLLLCLAVESMTLLYFGWLVAPTSLSPGVAQTVQGIHAILFFVRNGMPPLIIAFFTTALLPLTIEPADRDRATKATTSVNIAALQADLVRIGPLASRAEKIRALADQMALFEHASHATAAERARNQDLIAQLRRQSDLAADAPESAPDLARADVEALVRAVLAAQPPPDAADLDDRFAAWAAHVKADLRREWAAPDPAGSGQLNDAAPVPRGPRARLAPPKPGEPRFTDAVVAAARIALKRDQMPSIHQLAQEFQVAPQAITDAVASYRAAWESRQSPGSPAPLDPVLKALAVSAG